jgi:acylphosphatase
VTGPGSQQRQRLVAVARGVVQGVGYRWFVQREASRIGLVGWVANMADGSVEVVAEGSHTDLEQLVLALRVGPSAAMVDEVSVRHEPARGGLGGFDIRSGAHRGD